MVQKVLLGAHAEGRQFSVIVVDSRPMLEGSPVYLLHLSVNVRTDRRLYRVFCRQTTAVDPCVSWYSVHVYPSSSGWCDHQRSLTCSRRRTFNSFERRRVLKSRHSSRRHDGKAAFVTIYRVLRDVQILRRRPVRQLHEERIRYAIRLIRPSCSLIHRSPGWGSFRFVPPDQTP